MIIHDLPDAGQHSTRTVQIGPDDMMYISVGSRFRRALRRDVLMALACSVSQYMAPLLAERL